MLNYCNYLLENIHTFIRYNRIVIELNNLSNHELETLGLTRGEIPVTAYKSILNK